MTTTTRFTATAALLVSLAALSCPAAWAGSSVWKISKSDDYFYLGGTIHVLSAADYPLPEEFIDAFGDADALVFETDMAAVESPEYQQKLRAAITYSDDRTLAGELDAETYDKLKRYMASRYLPIDRFATMQPWGLTLVITMLEYQRLGMEPDHGVDAFFYRAARTEGKPTLFLETPDEQLAFIQSMAAVDPNDTIRYTLLDVRELPEFSRFLVKTWRSGKLENFTTHPYLQEWQSSFPELYHEIITRRNDNWMAQLPALLDNETTEFVLVGALHLNGEGGLLRQLAAAGFEVEQF